MSAVVSPISPAEASSTVVTVEQYAAVCHRYAGPTELVRGKIIEMVRPKPIHGVVVKNVSFLLSAWVREGDRGVVDGESGIVTSRDPDSVRGPDVFFVPADHLPNGVVPEGCYTVPPTLVVEVLSQNDRWGEVRQKIDEYFAFGVEEVWVIEPELRRLDIARADVATRSLTGEADLASDVLPGFQSNLRDVFYRC